jgi:hypothetical protein
MVRNKNRSNTQTAQYIERTQKKMTYDFNVKIDAGGIAWKMRTILDI